MEANMTVEKMSRGQRIVLCRLADGYGMSLCAYGWQFSPGGELVAGDTDLDDLVDAGLIMRRGSNMDITSAGMLAAKGLTY